MDTINFAPKAPLGIFWAPPATVPTPEADSNLVDCENDPESLTNSLINSVLNPIVDSVAENPDAIARSSSFGSLQFLLKCAPTSIIPLNRPSSSKKTSPELFRLSRSVSILPTHALSKILDLVV